jgi:PHP family Zn ribbon phosphoesterase
MTNCFGELTQHIHAIETGLSSDPPMNWRLSQLDPFCLVSFSDLHSPDKMGRNATIFKCVPGFKTMREAIITQAEDAFGGTLELFPEEGKYHQDGHRKCGIVMTPEESLENDNTCPVCGKPLVLGVLHRVTELADRPKGSPRAHHAPMTYTIPLRELLAEIRGCGPNTKTVQKDYDATIATFGPELPLLTQEPLERINAASQSDLLTEAIRRVRAEEVKRIPGFDGEYGSISVFSPSELPYEKQRRKKPTAKPATPKKKAH